MTNAGDIRTWLAGQGLAKYSEAFASNDIDLDVLPELNDADLKDLGVASLGDRKRLLKAIASLVATNVPTGVATEVPRQRRDADHGQRIPSAERRQVTIMFCDLVGSTALSARLDPEDMREIIGSYHRCCAEQITKAGGFVAKYMGDGVLAYFGYPQAHEDDAERAVRAGLELIEAVPTLRAGHDATLKVRVGIATGLVVVGDLIGEGAAQEQGVVGETPNVAARLQALAEPSQVVISQSTRRLTGGLFEYCDLGRVTLKGLADAVQAWQVTGASAIQSRFEAKHEASLTPLVGREEELELLLRRWQRAKCGEGQVVLLSGEPGIGKSRLTVALQERLQAEPHTRLRLFCSPHHQDSAFYPTIMQLERAAGFERQDTPEAKLHKLASLLGSSSGQETDTQLLAELLSVPAGTRCAPLDWSPQRKKARTFEALLRQLESLTRQRPVLKVYEDVHWIDPTSRELLDLVIERVRRWPMLLLITFRPEFQPPWIGQPHVTTMALNRLDLRDGTALVQRIAGNRALSDEVINEIVDRTDGVPLFVEELTKAVVEAGDAHVTGAVASAPMRRSEVPATLHASLMARLDRLGPAAKEVAQLGAAIGRDFGHELLAAVARQPETELQATIGRLGDSGLVFQRGVPPYATYLFKHALVRDATYASLLKSRRQLLHASIASVLEDRFPEVATTEPERFAHHYTQAGLAEPAVTYWRGAGELAISRSAIFEAVAHLEHGLEALAKLPDNRNRQQTELELRLALAGALISTKSWGALEVRREYERARDLAEQIDDLTSLIRSTWGIWANQWVRDDVPLAVHTAQQLLKLTEARDDVIGRWIGHCMVGMSSFQLAAFSTASEQFQKALALDDLEQARIVCETTGHDVGVPILTYFSRTLAILGFPHQAKLRGDELLVRGRALSHTPSRAYSCNGACMTCWMLRDIAGLGSVANQLRSIVAEDKFPLWLAYSSVFTGWLEIEAGSPEPGCQLIGEGLAKLDTLGQICNQYFVMLLLANGQLRSGKIEKGFDTLDRAEALIRRTGSRSFEAEVHRLRGDLQLARSANDDAETSYRRALEIARSQHAKLWEMRAATSLSRLWRDQGKRHEARDVLAPVYNWFTEGLDTPDLVDAKALLDQLQ
jgi:class 3 adenylate cyclase/tetratricopeptide (TPR) repeat protein